MTEASVPAELYGTDKQQLVFLNTYWGTRYTFAAPETAGAPWTATARFGQHDQLRAQTAAGLLREVRDHYKANQPTGDGR
jgi:hypothetical protein